VKEDIVGESKWWVRMALVSVVAVTLSCERPQGTTGGGYKGPKKDRYGMAVIVKRGNECKVAGGPKNHVAQPNENVSWQVFHTCDRAANPLVVELTVKSATSGCPSSPFQDTPPFVTAPLNLDDVKELKLKVKAQGFPANTECAYQYSVAIQGQSNSEIDPELDIWP
jgi:hypothetical protein